jgi:hypothetical protein
MIDRTPTSDGDDAPAEPELQGEREMPSEPATVNDSKGPAAGEPRPAATLALLEERVRRLEDALAQLQDTRPLEARIASRVIDQVGREPAIPTGEPAATVRQSAAIMLDAGRQLLPAAASVLQAQANIAEVRARASAADAGGRSWLIVDLYTDLRTLFRMCRDPLYRTVWLPRALAPLGLLAAILTSSIWLHLLPGFGLLPGMVASLIGLFVNLLLTFILCKALQREIRHYRETLPGPAAPRKS